MRYNHAFDITFSLENENENGEATTEELIEALERRIKELKENPEEIIEACGYPFDTYQVEEIA